MKLLLKQWYGKDFLYSVKINETIRNTPTRYKVTICRPFTLCWFQRWCHHVWRIKIRTCFVNEWRIRSRTTFFGIQTFVNEEQFRKNMLETFLFLWFDCFSSYNLSKEIYSTKGSHKCLPCRRKIHCVVWTSYLFFYW